MTFSGDIPFIIGWILSDDSQQELMTTKSISDLSMFIPSRQYSNPCKKPPACFSRVIRSSAIAIICPLCNMQQPPSFNYMPL